MKKIILDTNFLLLPITMKMDIFTDIHMLINEPYQLLVLDKSIDELNKIIEEQKGKPKDAARMALQLLKAKNIHILDTEKQKSLYMTPNSREFTVDDIIVALADKETIVATQDKFLKKSLLSKGINIIILRGKEKLILGC